MWCKHTAPQEHTTRSDSDICCWCQKERENRFVFSAAQNDPTAGTKDKLIGNVVAVLFTGRMSFVSPSQQCQGTE